MARSRIPPPAEQALVESGFCLIRDEGQWTRRGMRLSQRFVEQLELHELDQLLAGVRDGLHEVYLSRSLGFYRIR